MEKVVVTGATGFIGKKLVEELIKRDYEVVAFGRQFYPVECERVYHLASPSTSHSCRSLDDHNTIASE